MANIENKNFTFNEMRVHVPVCTHKDPQKVLIIGSVDEEFKSEMEKHPVEAEYGEMELLTSKNEQEFDIIILAKDKIDPMLMANINKILKADGILTIKTPSYHKDEQELKNNLTLLGESFWIAMPYSFGHNTAILASKKYHPTADINLQRSDLLDDLNYYSTEIHHASFVFPAHIHQSLTGIAKR
ncbi:MAG: spermidine synthase [Campylobacterota bacterium]|nr:spermidine synthase [Campylobacterota bacterium]